MSTLSSSVPPFKIKTTPSHFSLKQSFTIIKCSKADGPLRRPSAPSLSPPPTPPSAPSLSPPPTVKPAAPTSPQPPSLKKEVEPPVTVGGGVTFEYQRKIAKELQDYFKQKKLEEAANRGPFFGFIAKNEIANGRQVVVFRNIHCKHDQMIGI